MRRFILSFLLLATTSAYADDWCHSRFVSKEGLEISVDYQIHGRPSRAGTYTADPIWINVSGALAGQRDLSIELKDIAAHGLTARDQVLALNLMPADANRFTVDGKLYTSANNSQNLRVRVGDRWLVNPANDSENFPLNMGHALWDTKPSCRFD